MPNCLLQVAGAIIVEARRGAPEAECALFDLGDIQLSATEPGAIFEVGYRTTVGVARQRLAESGVTAALAEQARAAAVPAIARAYARGQAVRCVVDRLDEAELFEARVYDAAVQRYDGTWLDLDALATDLALPCAAVLLQALHLAAVLAEQPDDATVFLETAELAARGRPGQRTLRRVDLDGARLLVDAMRTMKPGRGRGGPESALHRPEIVAWLRDRAQRMPAARERLAGMEVMLGEREAPTRGPLAETIFWNLEAKLSRGEATGVLEQLDAIEQRRGRMPATMYLRARVALLTSSEEPLAIAERVSSLSTSLDNFHELQLLAAQAWLAAADARRARAFARDLRDNVSVDDVLRMQAMEVLDATREQSSMSSVAPAAPDLPRPSKPPTAPPRVLSDVPMPRSPEVNAQDIQIPAASRVPSGMDMGEDGRRRSSFPAATSAEPTASGIGSLHLAPPGSQLPPFRVEPRGDRKLSLPPPAEVGVERVETLSLPPGFGNESPPPDQPPRDPVAARLACAHLARELARELRIGHGVVLRLDVDGLEMAQRYLREALVDSRVGTADGEREVMRYGAFLSELIARRLGGRWIEVESRQAGVWAMVVPSRSHPDEVSRVWPFGRVLRFVGMSYKERDLVSYFLELEARSR